MLQSSQLCYVRTAEEAGHDSEEAGHWAGRIRTLRARLAGQAATA